MPILSSIADIFNTQETNRANIRNVEDTNLMNAQLAREQNALNYKMFNEQNDWNLARRDEEWAYNDPSAQMERLLMAGINPITAIGNISSGQAQQLTSAQPAPAEAPTLQSAHVMPADLSQLKAFPVNALNAYTSIKRLNSDIEESNSRISLNEYEAALKQSQKTMLDIANEQNTTTFPTRLTLLNQSLENMKAEYSKLNQDTENAKALHSNILAQEDLIRSSISVNQKQVDVMEEQIQQGWAGLRISQQNANTSSAQFRLNQKEYNLDVKKFKAEIQRMNNDEIFRWLDKFSPRSSATGNISSGMDLYGVEVKAGASYTTANEANIKKGIAAMRAANIVMYDRVLKDPSKSNQNAYEQSTQMLINELKLSQGKNISVDDVPMPATWNVENPSRF